MRQGHSPRLVKNVALVPAQLGLTTTLVPAEEKDGDSCVTHAPRVADCPLCSSPAEAAGFRRAGKALPRCHGSGATCEAGAHPGPSCFRGSAVRGARLRGFYQCVLASRFPPPARVGAGQHVQPVLCLPLALHPATPPAPLPQLWEGRTGLGWGMWGSPMDPALLNPSLPSLQIFCARCSPNTAVLPHYGQTKPVRVCTHCYTTHLPPASRCARSQ